MQDSVREDLEILSLVSLMFMVGLIPQFVCDWILFLSVFIYMIFTYKVFITNKATGHHKFGEKSTYICRKSGKELHLNEDNWNAVGTEYNMGPIACGIMEFTNSYRVPAWSKYVGLKARVPNFFSVGIDIGVVRGYRAYYDEGQMKSGIPVGRTFLFFMAPTIRWRPAHKRNTFVSIRQFGSATVTTEGSIEL